MKLLEALRIVHNLAEGNVLEERQTVGSIVLEQERREQELAVEMVGGLIALLETDRPVPEDDDDDDSENQEE